MPVGEEFAIANDLDAYIPCLLHAQLLRILATPGPAANQGSFRSTSVDTFKQQRVAADE